MIEARTIDVLDPEDVAGSLSRARGEFVAWPGVNESIAQRLAEYMHRFMLNYVCVDKTVRDMPRGLWWYRRRIFLESPDLGREWFTVASRWYFAPSLWRATAAGAVLDGHPDLGEEGFNMRYDGLMPSYARRDPAERRDHARTFLLGER